jgi:sugar phosphate isomerase/epimerase
VFTTGIAISPTPTGGPLLFAGRLEHGLERAAQLGFAAVELSVRAAAEIDRLSLAKRLEQLSLSLSAIATGQACLHDGACLAARDRERRDAAVERLLTAIELAGALGADVIIGSIRGSLSGNEQEHAKQRDAFHTALRRCAAAAGRVGVTLLIEPINRYETNFIHTTADGLAAIETVGEDNVRLLLDSFHMNIEEVSLDAALRAAGDRLGYLHLADSNRHAPGQGHLDFDTLLATALEVGYRGPAVVEILPVPDDETAVRQAAAFWAGRSGHPRRGA